MKKLLNCAEMSPVGHGVVSDADSRGEYFTLRVYKIQCASGGIGK